MFDIVVAVDLDWGIGKDGALPWPKLHGDMQHFRRITTTASEGRRNAVVMGRKTWDSAEMAGKALPGRLNVVVSRGAVALPAGVVLTPTIDAALAIGETEAGIAATFVIGGAGLIREVIDRAELRYVYLTRITGRFDCDVHMPDLDARGFVRAAWDGEREAEDNGVRYQIERLARG